MDWRTWPAVSGGATRCGALPGAAAAASPGWPACSKRAARAPSPMPSARPTWPRRRRYARRRECALVDGELLSWYGPRARARAALPACASRPGTAEAALASTIARMDIFKPLVALLAIVNPIGVIPFFIHFTQGFTARAAPAHDPRRRVHRLRRDRGQRAGRPEDHRVLRHLAGLVPGRRRHAAADLGRCRCSTPSPPKAAPDDVSEGNDKVDAGASIAIVPLTIPLLTGPATISTMVIYAEKTRHWWQLGVLVGYGVVIGLVGVAGVQPVGAHRQGARQDRHQRDDAADGPDPGGAGGRGDVRRAGQAVPGAGQRRCAEPCR